MEIVWKVFTNTLNSAKVQIVRDKREDRTMKTFKANANYVAKNYRTGKTFTVKCVSNKVNRVTFIDNNGNKYDGYVSDCATNYDMIAHCTKQRVTVNTNTRTD